MTDQGQSPNLIDLDPGADKPAFVSKGGVPPPLFMVVLDSSTGPEIRAGLKRRPEMAETVSVAGAGRSQIAASSGRRSARPRPGRDRCR